MHFSTASFSSLRKTDVSRFSRYMGALLLLVATVYVASTVHVLISLDRESLISRWIMAPGSPSSSLYVPVPTWVTDIYWTTRGHALVVRDEVRIAESTKYVASALIFSANNRGGGVFDLEHQQYVNEQRALPLLRELHCASNRSSASSRSDGEYSARLRRLYPLGESVIADAVMDVLSSSCR